VKHITILMILLFTSVAFAINASGSSYEVGRFSLVIAGGMNESGSTYESESVTSYWPVTGNATGGTYDAHAGIFSLPSNQTQNQSQNQSQNNGIYSPRGVNTENIAVVTYEERKLPYELTPLDYAELAIIGGVLMYKRKAIGLP